MKAIKIFIFIFTISSNWGFGQPYSVYSNDSLIIESEYLQETIHLKLHLPETQPFAASTTRYPITLIFDSQHKRTYPHLINSIDLLTSETQMPESIIIGVPFNFKNRFYLTSNQKLESDSLSGIERMELFLFSELIPKLQNELKGNDFISFIGHSRTAFLVNYLAFKRPGEVNIAVSLSGFFMEQPLSIHSFFSMLTNPDNFPNKFNYYYTAGTTQEESTYLSQFNKLDSLLSKQTVPENVKIEFNKTLDANHITNYWLSLPPILVDAFSEYNAILDNWLFTKLKSENDEISVSAFLSDLEQAGVKIGMKLNPNLTQIFTLASHCAYEKEDYKTAIGFLELGTTYFPDYLECYIDIIDFYKVLNETKNIDLYKDILREKTLSSDRLNDSEKTKILQYISEK